MQGVRELVDGGRIQIELQAMTVASPAKMLSKGLHDALRCYKQLRLGKVENGHLGWPGNRIQTIKLILCDMWADPVHCRPLAAVLKCMAAEIS